LIWYFSNNLLKYSDNTEPVTCSLLIDSYFKDLTFIFSMAFSS
jgi:hypothetical protein